MIPYAEEHKGNIDTEISESSPYYEDLKKPQLSWQKELLVNQPLKVIASLSIFAIVLPALLYHFVFAKSLDLPPRDGYSAGACLLPREVRLPCGEGQIPESACHSQCCYDLDNHFCYHRQPSRFSYIIDREWAEGINLQPRVATEPFALQPTLTNIRLTIDEVSKTHLSLSLYNPRLVQPMFSRRIEEKDYSYSVSSPEISITVFAGQGRIFTTNRGPMIASDNIWEMAFQLTNETMYGLGEIPLSATEKPIVLYSNRDASPLIPLIYAKFNNSYHGLLIDVDAPTEIFTNGDNQIIVRSLTTKELKFHIFTGPKPKDIMNDLVEYLNGEHGNELEYWMMGAHVCNELSETSSSNDTLIDFLSQAELDGLPYESHCGFSPLVFNEDCEYPGYVERSDDGAEAVKSQGKKYVPHLSPFVRYFEVTNSTKDTPCHTNNYKDLMLTNPLSTSIYLGLYKDKIIAYPSYDQGGADQLVKDLWKTRKDIDGVVLENSWPVDESFTWTNETHTMLPYFSKYFEEAFKNTPLWNATHPDGTPHYQKHNKYGKNFDKTIKRFTGNTKPIYTSSQWTRGTAIVYRQNVDTSWSNLRRTLVEAALGGISGNWLWSSPICGDTDNFNIDTQSELCVKWYMAATYLPLVRIHSKTVLRHPLIFDRTHKRLMIEALNRRTSFLPYFYTVLHKGPLLRPMFYQYPEAEVLQNLLTQYNIGEDIIMVPNLLPRQSVVHFWVPPGTWYELWGGLRVDAEEGAAVSYTTLEAEFMTFVRGGAIVPLQMETNTSAEETRRTSPYTLIVAMECNRTENFLYNFTDCYAYGQLYINKNLTLNFQATSYNAIINYIGDLQPICGNPLSNSTIKELRIYGLDSSENNKDSYKSVEVALDLCELEVMGEINVVYTT